MKTGYNKVALLAGGGKATPRLFADAAGFGVGVDGYRIQDALRTHNNVGVENDVPQDGVWGFAVKN